MMTRISFTSLALLIAAMSFIASPSMAGHCRGGHADRPECEPPGPMGIGVLKDDSGGVIGTVVGIAAGERPEVSILFESSGHTFSATVITKQTSELSGFKAVNSVWFSEPNCSCTQPNCVGEAWVAPNVEERVRFFEEFRGAIIVNDNDTNVEQRRLFHVPPGSELSLSVAVQSKMISTCEATNDSPQDLFPAIQLDPDLHSTFPKDYTLELN